MPPGMGFVVFILPVILGVIAAVFLSVFPKLRRFASYALLIPLLGSWGASLGLDAGFRWADPYLRAYMYGLSASNSPANVRILVGFLGGGILGALAGALSGYAINRVARMVFVHT